jgi:hypothetical protein
LGLEIQQRPLDLYRDHLIGADQHNIDGPAIPSRSNGNLEPYLPPRMGGCSERLGDAELAGVTQTDAISWIEADRQVVPHGRCESVKHIEARRRLTVLDLADQALADASPLRNLLLREAGNGASRYELPSEPRGNLKGTRAESDPRRGHVAMVAGGVHRPVTTDLLVRLLGCAT